ncbi:MBOAT family O-acyltransferase [Kineothrix sedimenti]|uniref:MBOAT family O-acyltransferase n=1 Tax=Kineothrix sedimenti TaxID=3123317 RepID=A0ABZ3EVW9_9FIRM
MAFTSTTFLFLFLPILLLIYIIIYKFHKIELENLFLVIVSIIFYAWGGLQSCVLLIISIAINYVIGLLLDKWENAVVLRRSIFIIGIIINLGMLVIYKYSAFLISIVGSVGKSVDINFSMETTISSLPLGISFFTFSIISYLADVYSRKVIPQKNPIKLALFVMLFPKLIMGPIVRYSQIEKDFENREVNLHKTYRGLIRFVKGFCKKMLLANQMGIVADAIFSMQGGDNFVIAWIGALAYTLQIYIDFSSYTDMAIGLGNIFGFTFAENFDYPYVSKSIQEFWRRWHITLSSWFRDYVYIPLGGNRKGKARTYVNLGIVFLLTGIWHGANWTFIFWGIYHGFFLILERIRLREILQKAPRAVSHMYTMLVVIIGWVMFRAESIPQAIKYITSMFQFRIDNIWQLDFWKIMNRQYIFFFIISVICCIPAGKIRKKLCDNIISDLLLIGIFIFSIYFMLVSEFNPFIYLRF